MLSFASAAERPADFFSPSSDVDTRGESGGDGALGFHDTPPPAGRGRGTGAGAGGPDEPPLFSKAAILSFRDMGFFGGSDMIAG